MNPIHVSGFQIFRCAQRKHFPSISKGSTLSVFSSDRASYKCWALLERMSMAIPRLKSVRFFPCSTREEEGNASHSVASEPGFHSASSSHACSMETQGLKCTSRRDCLAESQGAHRPRGCLWASPCHESHFSEDYSLKNATIRIAKNNRFTSEQGGLSNDCLA
jgi:hypothetical protein